MRLSDVPEVTPFVTIISNTRSTSLGMALAGNLKLDFMAKKALQFIFWLEYTFRCHRDIKTTKTLLAL